MTELLTSAGSIAAELNTRLSGIRLANGCETDIGRTVLRGRRKMPGDDEPPCIVLFEGGDDTKDQPGRVPQVLISQAYLIDGFDKCDPDNPNDAAHAMIRDIKRALFADGTTLGKRVRACNYLGRDIGPRPDGAALVQARVMISVEYIETLATP
ncbi:MAG: hypothetical protein ABJA84_00080 [Polaromonas sp.]